MLNEKLFTRLLESVTMAIVLSILLTSFVMGKTLETKTYNTPILYPYQLIVRMSDTVELSYENIEGEISCSAAIHKDEFKITTKTVVVTKSEFMKHKFKACLPRGEAKKVLKRLFN